MMMMMFVYVCDRCRQSVGMSTRNRARC